MTAFARKSVHASQRNKGCNPLKGGNMTPSQPSSSSSSSSFNLKLEQPAALRPSHPSSASSAGAAANGGSKAVPETERQWINFNDSDVTYLSSSEFDNLMKGVDTRAEAYLFFYDLIAPSTASHL